MFKELFERTINLDKTGNFKYIKVGYMIILGGIEYRCVEVNGYLFTFEDEAVNQYSYDAIEDVITPL